MGAQTTYTRKIADEIARRLSTGEFLRAICRDMGLAAPTVCGWVAENIDGFAERYAHARTIGYDMLAEGLDDLAGDNEMDEREIEVDGVTKTITNPDNVQRAKLRVDTRKWLLSKWHRAKYGDASSVDLNIKGELDVGIVEARKRSGG